MNYTVIRDGQQYGPYTLADLQRYAASGEVLLTDLAVSDASSEPVSVSQIIGTIPVPVQVAAGSTVSALQSEPDPPNLHWGLVLLFAVLTCNVFTPIWGAILAGWLKKVSPQSKALNYYIAALSCFALIIVCSIVGAIFHPLAGLPTIINLGYIVLALVARFTLRSDLEAHYSGYGTITVSLSGIMTFFFSSIYFQYHINEIVRRKRAEALELTAG